MGWLSSREGFAVTGGLKQLGGNPLPSPVARGLWPHRRGEKIKTMAHDGIWATKPQAAAMRQLQPETLSPFHQRIGVSSTR